MEECLQETDFAKADAPGISTIFLDFLKLGCTAFGGPAIITHIRELAVTRRKWLDSDTFRDGLVLSQSIPGATAMQVAAYVGLKTQGIGGAAAAYVGLGLPAFFLMLLLSAFYATSHSVAPIVALFSGLQVFVVGVVAYAAFTFGREIFRSGRSLLVAFLSAGLLLWGIGPFSVILGSGISGALLFRNIIIPPATYRPRQRTKVLPILLTAATASAVGLGVVYLANPKLFSLSVLMLRINSLAFGGGLSALPLMHHEIVSRGWMDSRALMDGIALGQITPGPISITGTFIGFLLFGTAGGIVATAATFTPPFVMLVASEPYFDRMKSSQLFARASRGIMCCFVGLLVYVTYRFSCDIPWDGPRIFLVAAVFTALARKVDVLLVILVSAIFSVVRL